jgi:hypothetical protein
VPAAAVLADLVRPRDGPAGERVGQAGLPHPGGADHRQDVDAESVLADRLDRGCDVVAQVGLGQDDDRRGPAAPGDREVALDPAEPRVTGERVDHQDDVDVGRDDLGRRRPAGDRAHEGAPPGQDLGRELAAQRDPVAHGRAAQLGLVERPPRDHPAFPFGGQDGEPAAVDACHTGEDDARWRFVTPVPAEE